MSRPTTAQEVSIAPVTADERALLERLVQLYAYDWSEILPAHLGGDGIFDGLPLDAYFADPARHALVARVEGRLAGFALVDEGSRLTEDLAVFDMAEFFVMRGLRRRGVGRAVAFAVFDRFPGRWEVRQRDENAAATAFWRRVIGGYTAGRYEEVRWDGPEWRGPVQSFVAGPRP